MKTLGVLLAIVGSTSLAHADRAGEAEGYRGYLAGSVIASNDALQSGGFALDVSRRMGDTPAFFHFVAHGGRQASVMEPLPGSYTELRGGFEGRTCTSRAFLCAAAGVDLGLHFATYEDPDGDELIAFTDGAHDSVVLAPRVAIDAGYKLRMRVAFELPLHAAINEGSKNVAGAALSIGLGMGF